MIEFISRTLWNGAVGIPDYVIKDAVNQGENIRIFVRREGYMTINSRDLESAMIGQSEGLFRDKFGKRPPYRLKYYKWLPDTVMAKLL